MQGSHLTKVARGSTCDKTRDKRLAHGDGNFADCNFFSPDS